MTEEAVESRRATVLPNFMDSKSKSKRKLAADSVYRILKKKMKRLKLHELNNTGHSASTNENM